MQTALSCEVIVSSLVLAESALHQLVQLRVVIKGMYPVGQEWRQT